MDIEFPKDKHIKFLNRCLNVLPQEYSKEISNHLSIVYFVVGSLDLLGEWKNKNADQKLLVDYIYSLQNESEVQPQNCGFRGYPFLLPRDHPADVSSIAMTYVALALLKMCGDDLSRCNTHAIVRALSHLQLPDGSFASYAVGDSGREADIRFAYCACVISHMLNDWSGVNKEALIPYIYSCQSFDGGFGQNPFQESHGGSTYCAIAALHLLGCLNPDSPSAFSPNKREKVISWCIKRQVSGLQGRIGKDPDSCYSFWIGGTLNILGCFDLLEASYLKGFIMSCQHPIGGFSKWPEYFPDVLHTYFSFCGLSLIEKSQEKENIFSPLDCTLGMTLLSAGVWAL